MSFIPLTPDNFDEHKKRILGIIENMRIEDLDSDFEMSLKNGIMMGNHANKCDACNVLHYLMAFVINKHRLETEIELDVKTSGEYEYDPKGALHALDKTNVAVFVISKSWFDDKRAQAEWQHAVDLGKPMIYIMRNLLPDDIKNKSILNYPNLCGTINDNTKTNDAISPEAQINLRKMIESVAKTQKMQ